MRSGRPTTNARGRLLRPGNSQRCDHCNDVVRRDGVVWWLERPRHETHPYLHTPYEWHYGHEACLASMRAYRDPTTGKPRAYLRKTTVVEFLKVLAPQYRQWWSDHNKHWGDIWGKDEAEDAHADAFRRFSDRLSAVKNPR
jgi:hypothetical protein